MKIAKLLESQLVVRDTSWDGSGFPRRSFCVESVGKEHICSVYAGDKDEPTFSVIRPTPDEAEELAWFLAQSFRLYQAAKEVLDCGDTDSRLELAHVLSAIESEPQILDRKTVVTETIPAKIIRKLVPVQEAANASAE